MRAGPSASAPASAVRKQTRPGSWIYQPIPGRRVLIATYGCIVLTPDRPPVVSHEHKELGVFTVDEVPELNMPDGYKQAIAAWSRGSCTR